MNIARILFVVILLSFFARLDAQDKMPLNHSVYDGWKSISDASISNDGKWVTYEINPQEGDGNLFLYEVQNQNFSYVERGYKPVLSSNSNILFFNIKPQFDTIRSAKLKKVKKDKLPIDSLGVLIVSTGEIRKYANLLSLKIPENKSDWLAFTLKMKPAKNDTTVSDTLVPKKKSNKKDKKKEKGELLVILNPITGDSVSFENVTKYAISKNGNLCSFVRVMGDSIDSIQIAYYNTNNKKYSLIMNEPGYSENIEIDEQGNQFVFTFSTDTIKEKAFGLYYYDVPKNKLKFASGDSFSNLVSNWSVSENGKIYFNKSGSELYFGTVPKPVPALKDTLTEDEKVSVDIWNWKDVQLQPQQLKQLEQEQKRSYTAVYFPKKDRVIQLADEKIKSVSVNPKAEEKYSLGFDHNPYQRMTSWEASRYQDIYIVNRETGHKTLVLTKVASSVVLSPNQDYILWYNIADSSWNSYNIKGGNSINLTSDLGVNFYNEINDIPNEAYPYGFVGWTKEGYPVVYDSYDLWQFDPSGKQIPVVITKGIGRKNKIRFRYVKLDKELQYLPENILLSAFNKLNKDDGYYSINIKDKGFPKKLVMESFNFSNPHKAKNAEQLIWNKQSFNVFPDLYTSNVNFNDIVKITNANPQQVDYRWGNVKLVDWVSFNGDSLQGLLYTPENMNPDKKYPMLVYFYERYSDQLHSYYPPKPIRSVINFSYYVSNDYVIFIPDIVYTDGYPGPSAFDCIVSGTQKICDDYSYIDRSRLGIQGQSWGGYQVAYLVTQTKMYKAAMAGAPVSNMTSAYGGIRWGSGMSRAFQYEHTQSRIGGNLWDKLPLYMLNSPLFSADRVETPLLIMHNDEDGAVPWYQGIELFNALRRLNKPVWMLVYNGAPHNLKRRADCKDLTVRMQQFFDFYLKGAPEPLWMKTGVPAINKGKSYGFEIE